MTEYRIPESESIYINRMPGNALYTKGWKCLNCISCNRPRQPLHYAADSPRMTATTIDRPAHFITIFLFRYAPAFLGSKILFTWIQLVRCFVRYGVPSSEDFMTGGNKCPHILAYVMCNTIYSGYVHSVPVPITARSKA